MAQRSGHGAAWTRSPTPTPPRSSTTPTRSRPRARASTASAASPTRRRWDRTPVDATELIGENIDDPKLTSTATGYANFDYVELFAPGNRPRMEDVQQDRYGLNDCWLAASRAAIARSKEWVIRRAVMPLGDGTYMVKLNRRCYRLDAELPVNARGAAYGDPFATPEGALWFPLVEKAMAYAMWTGGTQYKYGDVETDTPGTAYNALGLSYDRYTLAEVPVLGIGTSTDEMFSYIKGNLDKAITITTEPGWLGVGSKLRSSHAYTVIDACRRRQPARLVPAAVHREVDVRRAPAAYNVNVTKRD